MARYRILGVKVNGVGEVSIEDGVNMERCNQGVTPGPTSTLGVW